MGSGSAPSPAEPTVPDPLPRTRGRDQPRASSYRELAALKRETAAPIALREAELEALELGNPLIDPFRQMPDRVSRRSSSRTPPAGWSPPKPASTRRSAMSIATPSAPGRARRQPAGGRGGRGRGGGRAGVLGGPAEFRTLGCLGSGEPAFERGLKLGVPAVSGPGALDPQPRLPPVDADGGELVVKSRLLHEPPADLGV